MSKINIYDDEEKEEKKDKKREDCKICCSSVTKYVVCPYCSYLSCNVCNERVILESINKPSCVSCRKEFSNAFFYDNFTKSFITKKYKVHRENLLYEKEKYLLPATQPEVERIAKGRKIEKEMREIDALQRELKIRKRQLQIEFLQVGNPSPTYLFNPATYNIERSEDKKESYVCSCPSNNCRGFLSSKYKCGLCGIQACPECREIKEEKHECDPNILKNVEEIKKTTRNCPNCSTLIFKISGCDQMWCTRCNVAFCWKTGKIEKGVVHNPHFFEYMRKNAGAIPRNPNEVRCGGMPHRDILFDRAFITALPEPITRFGVTYYKADSLLSAIYRQVLHIISVEIRGLPTSTDNVTNRDLRIEFLLKNISEEEFKIKLQRREKDRTKKLEYREVLELYTNVLQDLFTELTETKNHMKLIQEEEKVRKYVEEGIRIINNKYDCNLKYFAQFF